MIGIFFKQHLKWQWQQCAHIHNLNMHYHIGKVFWVVACNFNGLILQFQNKISTIQILSPLYFFMSISTFHVVLCVKYALSTKRNSANCVRLIQMQFLLQNFITENVLWWWIRQWRNFVKTSTFLSFEKSTFYLPH